MDASSKTYLSCADTAKHLRKALKAEFPGVKFSVRSKTYSGGASITAYWTDGPKQADVQAICDRYSGASFDGMIDLKSHHDSLLSTEDGFEVVHFGADFVFATRTISPDFYAEFAEALSEFVSEPVDLAQWGTHGYNGEAWNKRYAVAVDYYGSERSGALCHDSHRGEYGGTLAHQWCGMRVG